MTTRLAAPHLARSKWYIVCLSTDYRTAGGEAL